MKKFILFFFALVAISAPQVTSAQCTPDPNIVEPGIQPDSDSLDCIIKGAAVNETIYFKNFSTIEALGQQITVTSLRLERIGNLPCGLRYAFDRANKTYGSGETGCISVVGSTNDVAGQYKLQIIVSVTTSPSLPINLTNIDAGTIGDLVGGSSFGFWVRVKDTEAAACPAVDTARNADNKTATCASVDFTSSRVASANFGNTFNVYPNPFSGQGTVSFIHNQNQSLQIKMFNLTGKEVYTQSVQAERGVNSFDVVAKQLITGIYFLSVTDGKNVLASKKVMVQ